MPEFQLGDTIPDQESLIRALRGMSPAQRGQGMPGYQGAQYMGGRLVPGITNYLTQDMPPPSMQANPSGKVPSGDNPYLPSALGEAGLMGLGGGAPGLLGHVLTGVGSGLIAPAEAAEKKPPAPGKKTTTAMAPPQSAPPEPEPEPVPGGGRPAYTKEDLKRLNEIQAEIKRLTANPGDSPRTTRQTLQGLQQEESDIRSNMRTLQTAYDKSGQPLSMRQPDLVNALRGGAFGAAAAHGAARGLLKENPLGTVGLGAMEALGGAFAPTFFDLFAPQDTQAYKQSHQNLHSPDYWENVIAPDVLYGGGVLSGTGHGIGRTLREAGEQGARGVKNLVDWRRSLREPPPDGPPGGPEPPGGQGLPPPTLDLGPEPNNAGQWGLPDVDPASPRAITSVLRKDAKGRKHAYPLFGEGPTGRFAPGTKPPAND